jgi:hypothetical protein
MGTFHVGCKIENHLDRQRAVTVPVVLVDSGSEYTWIPAKTLEKIIDEVVFAEPGDLTLLGARTLEGLSLGVDTPRERLVTAGPLLAA